MSLDPQVFQDTFEAGFLQWIMIENKGDTKALNPNDNPQSDFDFYYEFSNAYKTYAEDGIIVGVDITTKSEDGRAAMEGVLKGANASVSATSTILAEAFVTFWAEIIDVDSMTLEHGGVAAVSNVNDAMSKLAPVDGMIKSVLGSDYNPNAWADLIAAVESVIKTILWQVTENFTCGTSLCPITFPEVVS